MEIIVQGWYLRGGTEKRKGPCMEVPKKVGVNKHFEDRSVDPMKRSSEGEFLGPSRHGGRRKFLDQLKN